MSNLRNAWELNYTGNITYVRSKIDNDILAMLSPNATEHQLKDWNDFSYIPAENASQRFSISESRAIRDGGEYFLRINVQPGTSLDDIDPFVTEISNKCPELNGTEAWVGLNNIEEIASLPNVKRIASIGPPDCGPWIPANNSEMNIPAL
jgi:hypothetical protein